jgi:dTDP-4-dehydrorhamnose 3,5-epimerase-like enzyme
MYGDLGVLELGESAPFEVRRVYWLVNTPSGVTRGLHAHKALEQLIFVPKGTVTIVLDDGRVKTTHVMTSASPPLHVRPGIWRTLDAFSDDAVVMVLASATYDASDYIHDYEAFLEWRGVE